MISQKYKNLKKSKKSFLLNEEELETIEYDDEPQEDLFRRESILEAANKALDFEAFKKQQEAAINNFNRIKKKAIEKVQIAEKYQKKENFKKIKQHY